MNRHVLTAGVLDATQVKNLRATGGHLEHLLVGDLGDATSPRDDARVGGEHSVDVGVDLAEIGTQRARERDRGGVGGSTPEGGDVLRRLRNTLKSRDDDDVTGFQGLLDASRSDVDNAGIAMGGGRDDTSLGAGVRAGRDAQVGQGHGQQRSGLTLTGRQEHVELSRSRLGGNLKGQIHEIVSGVTHGGDDDDDVITSLFGCGNSTRHALDRCGVGHRGPTEFLDDSRHQPSCQARQTKV